MQKVRSLRATTYRMHRDVIEKLPHLLGRPNVIGCAGGDRFLFG